MFSSEWSQASAMAPPAPVSCSVQGCDWVTPANVPTWELLRDMLQIHVGSVHGVPARGQEGGQPAAVRPKPAPVARPEIDLGASEHEWKFFVAEFERYKRTTGISGTTVLDELWHCQAKSLRSLMQAEASITNLDTEQSVSTFGIEHVNFGEHVLRHSAQLTSTQLSKNLSNDLQFWKWMMIF